MRCIVDPNQIRFPAPHTVAVLATNFVAKIANNPPANNGSFNQGYVFKALYPAAPYFQ